MSDRPPLDPGRLRARLLRRDTLWCAVDVVDSTGSTNADLRRAADAGAAEGTVLIAEEQVSGRGRLDRRWLAPPRSSLAVSFLLRPPPDAPGAWGWLPLLTGLAAGEAVARLTGVDARVKWPNDVVVEERKLAGILAEHVTTAAGAAVVVGVGLNVSQTPDELPFPAAVSLLGCGASDVDRSELAAVVLERVDARYQDWLTDPARLRGDYLARSATVGRPVNATMPGGTGLTGTAVDVDVSGRLVVEAGQARHHIAAGDVVHLRADVS